MAACYAVPAEEIRLVAARAVDDYKDSERPVGRADVGARCEALWSDSAGWYPGRIVRHDTVWFKIAFDDGGVREDVPAAEIRLDAAGNWLFVGNRGHDSLAVFAVTFDGATPRLRRAHVVKTGGACPRNFAVLESHIVVGNQDTNELVVFRREVDGNLTEVSRRAHRSPNFLAPLVAPPPLDTQKTIGKCPSPRANRSLAGVFVEPPPAPLPELRSPLRAVA